jgi:hypothetical protein
LSIVGGLGGHDIIVDVPASVMVMVDCCFFLKMNKFCYVLIRM